MKSIYFISISLFLFSLACGKNPNKTLDGKSYQVSSWDISNPEKQDPDLIVFKNGMMDSESCHQYGFTAAPYQSTYSNGIYTFTSTISSPVEGKMIFEGMAKDNLIEGKMVWKKDGQADILYAFKGNLKSE